MPFSNLNFLIYMIQEAYVLGSKELYGGGPHEKLIRVNRFWRIEENQTVLGCKKKSKTISEMALFEILRRFFRT
jgi:hypothetical protein